MDRSNKGQCLREYEVLRLLGTGVQDSWPVCDPGDKVFGGSSSSGVSFRV